MADQWFVIPVNPEPWVVPPFTVARRGGKMVPQAMRDAGLHAYQEAVKEALSWHTGELLTGEVELEFYFWRQMEEYKTSQSKLARNHEADATNMQKALEDALQGILFTNDRNVRRISSTIINQSSHTEPMIVVGMSEWTQPMPGSAHFPQEVENAIRSHVEAVGVEVQNDNSWPPRG